MVKFLRPDTPLSRDEYTDEPDHRSDNADTKFDNGDGRFNDCACWCHTAPEKVAI